MPEITFLEAAVPLTKTFTQAADGSITKEPYPVQISNFTTHTHKITTLLELHKLITAHAELNHCLQKGVINKALKNESRKGNTNTIDNTDWVCLDFDRHVATDVNEELDKLGLSGVSYVMQWSASHGTPGTEGTLSCHVFMLLSASIAAPTLKAWLQSLNFSHFNDDIKLTRDGNGLRWPLDVTTCQNDKLLYIANPIFIGMKDPLKGKRIEFVKGKKDKLDIARIGEAAPEILRKKCTDKRNELRRAAGMTPIRAGTTFIGEHEVQNKPGQATVTGVKECGDYTRLNLNGSDSWAYWHFNDNFELLFSFKSPETAYRLKEICPNYYSDLVSRRNSVQSAPNGDGDLVLAICDKETSAYWKVLWNAERKELHMYPAKSETQLDHWLQAHGLLSGPFVPQWKIGYHPREDWRVDTEEKEINMFVRSTYMRDAEKRKVDLKKECPTIMRVINSMVGDDQQVLEAFMNWFACLFQRIGKPIVSWTFHGIEGTGKGTFFTRIATPLLHPANVKQVSMMTLQDQYNAWIKNKLLIYVDEVDIDAFSEESMTTSLLRMYITEDTVPVRDMRVIAQTVPNYFGIIFASNKPQPVYIPATDRRYNVGRFQMNKLKINAYERDVQIVKELKAFADYLHSYEASLERACEIVHTPDRERIAKLAVTSLQETAHTILTGDLEALWNAMPDEKHLKDIATTNEHSAYASAYAGLVRAIASDHILKLGRYDRLTRDEIRTIFQYCVGNTPATPAKFTSLLRHNGIDLKRIRRGEDLHAGCEITWRTTGEFAATLKQVLEPTKRLKVAR